MSIGGLEWVLIFVVALILFGPKKLPELGRAIGKSIREFKSATNGMLDDDDKQVKKAEVKVDAKEAVQEKAVLKEEVKEVSKETPAPKA
jgi:sec-independent protein translocase protein TatA